MFIMLIRGCNFQINTYSRGELMAATQAIFVYAVMHFIDRSTGNVGKTREILKVMQVS